MLSPQKQSNPGQTQLFSAREDDSEIVEITSSFSQDQIEQACSLVMDPLNLSLEQISFIGNLDNTFLQAFPGSGKTTCLVIKLICIALNSEVVDNLQGILVLSHTNVAIEQLKEASAKTQIDKIFNYPSFVGTFQSFVDLFFAIPFYEWRFDHDKHPTVGSSPDKPIDYFALSASTNPGLSYLFSETGYYGRDDGSKNEYHKFVVDFKFDEDFLKSKHTASSAVFASDAIHSGRNFLNPAGNSPSAKILNKLRQHNHLSFSDCFQLATCYIEKFPVIKKCVQDRFSHVFIDESQDMSASQRMLVDVLFLSKSSGYKGKVQIIGDTNQAIFHSGSLDGKQKLLKQWCADYHLLETTFGESKRYNQHHAKLVSLFADESHEGTAAGDARPVIFVANLPDHTSDTYINALDRLAEKIAIYHTIELTDLTAISPRWAYLGKMKPAQRLRMNKDTLGGALFKEILKLSEHQELSVRIKFNVNLAMIRYYTYKLMESQDVDVFCQQLQDMIVDPLTKLDYLKQTLKDLLERSEESESKPNEAETYRNTTIHSVKGETINNVILLSHSPSGQDRTSIFKKFIAPSFIRQTGQTQCLIYVACSRPSKTLSLVVIKSEWDQLTEVQTIKAKDYFDIEIVNLDHDK